MDNLTHTLVGLSVAEAALAVARARGAKTEPSFVRAAWVTSAIANNLPDADIALSALTEAPLGYLLHHRGHTHTVAMAPIMGLLSLGLTRLILWRGPALSRARLVALFALGVLGALLHTAMDAMNTYGVHPFWPLSNRWVAADLIFIVEPMLWLVLALPLSFSVEARWARRLLWAIAALGPLLAVFTGYVSHLAVMWLLAGGVAFFLLAQRLRSSGGRASLALVSFVFVHLLFLGGRVVADGRARTALNGAFPNAIEADVILSPEPGNPLCWNALAVSEEAQDLVLRRLHVSSSFLHPVALCRMPFAEDGAAMLSPIARSETEDIRFVDETRTPLERLLAMHRDDCRTRAYFQFSRAPFYVERDGLRRLGDLRYDSARSSFATFELPEDAVGCPQNLPPWEPWRSDILRGPLTPERHRFEELDL